MLVLPRSATLRERLGAVYGGEFAARLLLVNDVSGMIHVAGLVERPADVGTGTRRVVLSVNGRAVRDLGIVRAAEAAYPTTIPGGVRPTLFLDIVVAADMVDVNVHPAKAEVRFTDRWQVERVVEGAVRRALGTFEAGGFLGRAHWTASAPAATAVVDVETLTNPQQSLANGLFADAAASAEPMTLTEVEPAPSERGNEPVPALLQLRNTYIAFEHDHGIVLIDQHSAHERVLFERFMKVLDHGEAPGQRLLFPMTLHLGPAEAEAYERDRVVLDRLGFEIEGFGGHTLIVRAVPMPHPRFDPERCLRETLAAIAGDREAGAHQRHERLAATVACKAAIKAGDVLSPSEMRALFIALRDTTLPAHDVHGRSTIVQLTWDELDRRFGRR
jgi:DNA mismatch repair protein MutL